jgi:hypothetical protein
MKAASIPLKLPYQLLALFNHPKAATEKQQPLLYQLLAPFNHPKVATEKQQPRYSLHQPLPISLDAGAPFLVR